MRILILLVLLHALPVASPVAAAPPPEPPVTPKEAAAGWIALFDGETTFGWAPRGEARFDVQGGALVASGGRGLLGTTTEFADFRLKAQVWVDEKANSGLFFRCPTTGPITEANAYELNIFDAHPSWPTGSVNRVGKARTPVRSVGRWTDLEVTAQGDQLTVTVNGQESLSARDSKYRRGTIALQYNGEGTVRFRDVKLQPLGMSMIFSGTDLSGWKESPGNRSIYKVTDEGLLNVTNGRGELQTEATYGDFILQLEVITNGEHLNSGVFFRNIPGQNSLGYESQIHNRWEGGDRTKPTDQGTGAIYRRQPARRVVSNDREWFAKTIVAHGNHFAVWVNGIQVTDFTDTRPPHENPREGLRLKPGSIGLQGHDPTTDINFRGLAIVELPPVAPR